MRGLVRSVFISIASLIGLTLLFILIGHAQAAPDWTAQVACKQPCWAGLNPDLFGTPGKVMRALEKRPEIGLQSGDGGHIFEMMIGQRSYQFYVSVEAGADMAVYHVLPLEMIYLGDVLTTFGQPDYFYHFEQCGVSACIDNIYLRFARQRIEAIFRVTDGSRLWIGSPLHQFVFGRLAASLRQGCTWYSLSRLEPQPECYYTNR